MNKFIFTIVLFFLISCGKEEVTFSSLNIYNETKYKITIIPYFNGVIKSNNIINLSPFENKELESLTQKGLSDRPIIFYDHLKLVDSFIVKYDDTIYKIHNGLDSFILNKKVYNLQSNRNLFSNSYSTRKTENTKTRRKWEISYSFTEQDYIDAK